MQEKTQTPRYSVNERKSSVRIKITSKTYHRRASCMPVTTILYMCNYRKETFSCDDGMYTFTFSVVGTTVTVDKMTLLGIM